MNKNWQMKAMATYELLIEGEPKGSMEFFFNTTERRAVIKLNDEEYIIRRTGFWKNSVEIVNNEPSVLLKVSPVKWYGNKYKVDYMNAFFTLVIRNNPLAEWALLSGEKVFLAYGLDSSEGKASIRITDNTKNSTNLLPDFLLWYLFLPVAVENSGDSFIFSTLLNNP